MFSRPVESSAVPKAVVVRLSLFIAVSVLPEDLGLLLSVVRVNLDVSLATGLLNFCGFVGRW